MSLKFNKYPLLIGLFFFSFQAFPQKIDSDRLLSHLKFLSSDDLAGRSTLSEGGLKARAYVLENLTSLDRVEPLYPDFIQYFSFENARRNKTYEDAANIVTLIPGSETNRVIVVSAHYDHVGIGRPNSKGDSIYNGADDNASGTSALLEIARYFSQNRPKHSMIFVAFDAEELGLRGAKAFTEDFPYPMEQIAVNVNMDMISRNDQNEIFASGTFHNPYLKEILEKASNNSNPSLKFGHDTPGTGREDWTKSSDHGAFFDKKVPHIYFGVEDHEDYHKPSDEFENIQPEFFINSTNLILKCILALDQELLQSGK